MTPCQGTDRNIIIIIPPVLLSDLGSIRTIGAAKEEKEERRSRKNLIMNTNNLLFDIFPCVQRCLGLSLVHSGWQPGLYSS